MMRGMDLLLPNLFLRVCIEAEEGKAFLTVALERRTSLQTRGGG
jgi:hypothetical protein